MTTAAVSSGSLPTPAGSLAFHVSPSDDLPKRSPPGSSLEQQQQQQTQRSGVIAGCCSLPNSSSDSNIAADDHGGDLVLPGASKIPDSGDDSVDSALLAALRDPRERLGLLKLEQVFQDFFQSSDPYWEVGGAFNSRVVSPSIGLLSNTTDTRPQTTFQRCLLHRLADRFHITREPTGMDGLIRLWKTPETKQPKRLLLDLDASEYELVQSVEKLTVSAPKPPKANRKMKIMKRNSSNVSDISGNSKSTPRKNKKDHNDKEKAYAEARARIFKDEQQETSSNPPLAQAPNRATPPSSNNYLNPPSPTSASQDQPQAEDDARVKATYRNRREEVNDPDFQRGGSMVVTAAPAYDYHYTTSNAPQNYYATNNQDYYAQAYYNNAGRGGGRGGGRGTFGYNNNYTAQTTPQYRRSHSSGEAPANLHSLEEFPSLR